MNELDLLKDLCGTYSPSGQEQNIYPVIQSVFKNLGQISISDLNNIYIHKKGQSHGKIMIMAHSDEVFLVVTDIVSNGFIKFKSVGIDCKTLVSQEVIIHGKQDVHGIIGLEFLEDSNEQDKTQHFSEENLLIDTGFSKNYIEKYIKIGDYIEIKRKFVKLLNNNVSCKAIDDRAGIASMYFCAKELQSINHYMDVYFVCSCQEEVGHRGAKMATYDINPDIGIAIDTTFDGGAMGDVERENRLGSGPVICIGPNVHSKLRQKIIDIALEYNIPYQIEVEPGNTGTDAWDIQVSRDGVPSILISIPIKYMHTSVEVVNMDDIKNTGRLVAKFIEKLDSHELEGVFCF